MNQSAVKVSKPSLLFIRAPSVDCFNKTEDQGRMETQLPIASTHAVNIEVGSDLILMLYVPLSTEFN